MTVLAVDRVVHASAIDVEVVRYGRSTRWFIEATDPSSRRVVSMGEAAQHAAHLIGDGGVWHRGREGGSWFDRKVFQLVESPLPEGCPLVAAILRGHDDDEVMWRIFDDLARIKEGA